MQSILQGKRRILRVLYLADRNFLVDDPNDEIFAPFGDARHKIEGGVAVFSREPLSFAWSRNTLRKCAPH